MKILFASWSQSLVGGCETYIANVLQELSKRGVEVRCFFENGTADRAIDIPSSVFVWTLSSDCNWFCVQKEIASWSPDIVFCHGLTNPTIERWLQTISASVLYAHGYYGTCISGTKTHVRPEIRACSLTFGYGCLAYYLPLGCGGSNPLTMLSQFGLQKKRKTLLGNYSMILTSSTHMASEMDRHSDRSKSKVLRLPISRNERAVSERSQYCEERVNSLQDSSRAIRLCFVGRVERNKGPDRARDAAPIVALELDRPVELTFIGDGTWLRQLQEESRSNDWVKYKWTGWLTSASMQQELARQDVLLVPSLWPEPFGLVGLEAAQFGVPAVSFGLGGIRDWLIDGVTGVLTKQHETSAQALAFATIGCLRHRDHYNKMCYSAIQHAAQWPDIVQHSDELLSAFQLLIA